MSTIEAHAPPMADPIAALKMKMERSAKFTRREKWMLATLVLANGRPVTRNEVCHMFGGSEGSRAFDVTISKLRGKLGAIEIYNVRDCGYLMSVADCEKARKILEDEA